MTDLGEWMNNQHEQYIDSVAQGYPNGPETPEYPAHDKDGYYFINLKDKNESNKKIR